MADYDPSAVLTAVGGGVATLVAIGLAAREWLKSRVLTDTNRDAAINGVKINDGVLANINAELERHSKQIKELEAKVAELTKKLASVRIVAIDCYAIATECDCGQRDLLLEHLKQIIQDS